MGRPAFFQVLPDFWRLVSLLTLETGLRYLVFAGLGWLLGYVVFRRRWQSRRIVAEFPPAESMWREFRWSLLTLVVFGVVGAATLWLAHHGYTRMYWRVGERGTAWFFLSVGLVILLHDTYFYWTHRWMHQPRYFRWIHRVHHQSTNPSPWAAYSFAPAEAVIQAGIFPLAVFLIPLHPLAFGLFMMWQIFFNVLGHLGYELYPRRLMDGPLGRVLNTATHHALHHEKIRGNYGIYFNLWDRLMGTNQAGYEARYRAVAAGAGREPVQPAKGGRS